MHHRVNLLRGEHLLDLLAIRQVCLHENGGGGHGRPMAFLKIVQGDHAMAAVEQHLRADASDVSGAAGHKNIQRKFSIVKKSKRNVRVYSRTAIVPLGRAFIEPGASGKRSVDIRQNRNIERAQSSYCPGGDAGNAKKQKRRTGPLPPVRRFYVQLLR
jgi:hypothetical protein